MTVMRVPTLQLILAMLFTVSAFAQHGPRTTGDSGNIDLLGRWARGPSFAVDAIGDTAFFGDGATLRIVDFSSPASPLELGSLVLPGPIFDIEVVGGLAFVADFEDGLRIVDVSNPALPNEIGFHDSEGRAQGVAVEGDIAVIADGEFGMRFIDVANPAAPFESGQHQPAGDWIWAVAVSGDQALGTGLDGELHIVDFSNPAAPFELGSYDHGYNGYGVDVSGQLAFVAAGQFIRVIDFSNPSAPFLRTGALLDTYCSGVTLNDDHLYVGAGSGGLEILELSLSAADTTVALVGSFDTEGSAIDVAVVGGLAFVSDLDRGLRAIDVSNPAAPVELGFRDGVGQIHAAAVVENLAYLADRQRGLWILDITDPAAPVELGHSEVAGTPIELVVQGNHAYIAANVEGLRILDVSDPANPHEVGSYPSDWSTDDVVVHGSYAYLAESGDGIKILDVSDPANPLLLGAVEAADGSCRRIVLRHPYAYTSMGGWGVSIFDIGDPSNPVEIGSYDPGHLGESVWGVAVEGDYLYAADHGLDKIYVINISDPEHPWEVTERSTPGAAEDLFVHNEFLYVATGDDGLRIFDLLDPAAPSEVGFYDTGDRAYSLAVGGTRVLMADDQDGLWLLGNTLATPVLLSSFHATVVQNTVHLRWEATGSGNAIQFRLIRSGGGGETEIGWREEHPGRFHAMDESTILLAGGDFVYLLEGREPGEPWRPLRSEHVAVPGTGHATELLGAWPNPFNPRATLRFRLAAAGPVEFSIHDAQGALVAMLVDRGLESGLHELIWDGRDGGGTEVGSGVYFARLRAGGIEHGEKLILLR